MFQSFINYKKEPASFQQEERLNFLGQKLFTVQTPPATTGLPEFDENFINFSIYLAEV
jgi:hypothetical protein